ncbi:MAG: hypothetical protein QGI78_07330 [Phycisphaerales bacterium]|jgi:hypothetical protein|nr:hypothetical protein [Phycisphaerales bacterium]
MPVEKNILHTKGSKEALNTTGIIAWVLSIGVHLGLGAFAFLITWTVIQTAEEPPPVITASWHEDTPQPMTLPSAEDELETIELAIPQIPDLSKQKHRDGLAFLQSTSVTSPPKLVRREEETEVVFMGCEAVSARNIVYVVDASGTSMLFFSDVLRSLDRSLRNLDPKQSFAILFFQKNVVIPVPPANKLNAATPHNIEKAFRWIETSNKVIPTGRSNPIRALTKAMSLNPDLIFLVSEDIRGTGEYEVHPDRLLSSLESLNPIDSRNGRRRVRINCIELLTQDPTHTMQKIAENHGGIDGYTFVDRSTVSNVGD